MRLVALLPLLLVGVLAQNPLVNYTVFNFTSFVDNYGYTGDTFNMRYFVDDQYFTGKAILFYCGNEGAIEMFIESSGFLPIAAQKLGAVLVFAEHRYFGESMPFGSASFASASNMKYLSPHQAMADYAYLLSYIVDMYGDAPVVVTGGSYGAMLAAWFRLKYPHLADISYAASAPIFHVPQTVEPEEYNQIISGDYAQVDQKCYNVIQHGFLRLASMIKNSANYYQLQNLFETCEYVNSPSVAAYLPQWLYNAYEYMAMTNYPYATNFLSPMPGWPVTYVCDNFILQETTNSPDLAVLQAMKNAANVYYNFSGGLECNEIIQDYDNDLGQEGWDYLACTTLVLPIAADGVNDMFLPNPWVYSTYAANCQTRFQRPPQPLYVQTFFGASNQAMNFSSLIYANQMIFTNGRLDPWFSGAVVESANPGIEVFNLGYGAHHLDLRSPNPLDPMEVSIIRGAIITTIQSWL